MTNFYKNIGTVSNLYDNMKNKPSQFNFPPTPGTIANKVNLNSDFFSSKVFKKEEEKSFLNDSGSRVNMSRLTGSGNAPNKLGLDHKNLFNANTNNPLFKTRDNINQTFNRGLPTGDMSMISSSQSNVMNQSVLAPSQSQLTDQQKMEASAGPKIGTNVGRLS